MNRRLTCELQATAIRSVKSLVPLLDRVLVQRIKAETKTASGIFLPESSVKELNEGRVLAVGPGALNKEGQRLAMGVQTGDRVLIPQVSLVSLLCRAIRLLTFESSSEALPSRSVRRSSTSSAIASKS
ncbi:chaperonin 10-like protein [Hypoxylon cercidicola]|nr:chaperonin 10-like protein [Hypoxylon cercidicola]